MKSFFALMVLILPAAFVAVTTDSDEEKVIVVTVGPDLPNNGSNVEETFFSLANVHHRSIRRVQSCVIPKKLPNGFASCRVSETRVVCDQRCVFGHTLSTGTRRRMTCKLSDSQWKPAPRFENCRPFVDCGVTLITAGRSSCEKNFLDKGPICDISCEKTNWKRAVRKRAYQCDLRGQWQPKLPHCAKRGSALLAVTIGSDEEKFTEVKVGPDQANNGSNGAVESPSPNVHSRPIRATKGCRIPKRIPNAHINCMMSPKRLICNQICTFGYTLKSGIRKVMECKFSEREWKPAAKFESCKPFIDCGITVRMGGRATCEKNNLDKGPRCEISCHKVNGKAAVEKRMYQCNIKGKWKPQLPHCVKRGSDLKLVPPPKGAKTVKHLY